MATYLDRLKARLELYVQAEEKILTTDQAWSSPEGMTYTRANLDALSRTITQLEAKIAALDPSSAGAGFNVQTFCFPGRR